MITFAMSFNHSNVSLSVNDTARINAGRFAFYGIFFSLVNPSSHSCWFALRHLPNQ